MKIGNKLRELFSHQKSIHKYLKSLDNDFTPKTIYIFLAVGIVESECCSDFTYYEIKPTLKLLDKMELVKSTNPHQFYREHKKLLNEGFIERQTKRGKYTKQQYNVTIYGRMQLRRIYNYLIRELYTAL
jgi:hypothetical protein